MGHSLFLNEFKGQLSGACDIREPNTEEVHVRVAGSEFRKACLFTHKRLHSPVMALFACDERAKKGVFEIRCVFLSVEFGRWFVVATEVPAQEPRFESLSRDMFSASLFERQIHEMFGILPQGHPDLRSLHLHSEVWPKGFYPLRKDFTPPGSFCEGLEPYVFGRVSGAGIFEVPVGPVHAGIIGPGHFRFSAAGEPIVDLEIRLGFTHRGVEKMFEGKSAADAVGLAECVAGDTAFAHSWAFCRALEKISGLKVPAHALYARALCLELERVYNHFTGIGGMSLDASFTYASQFATVLKEKVLRLNQRLTGHRYLKNFNCVGGVRRIFSKDDLRELRLALNDILKDHEELKKILFNSVSFMDRVDDTGVLRKKTAADLGVTGLAGRASGIAWDLRKVFAGVYAEAGFRSVKQDKGDALARLKVRIAEVEESCRLILHFAEKLAGSVGPLSVEFPAAEGAAIGAVEAWRGPVFYWVDIRAGAIERCKIVDASFRNWAGLTFAVLGNIIPDFPLCNKSFDLSYPGNDL